MLSVILQALPEGSSGAQCGRVLQDVRPLKLNEDTFRKHNCGIQAPN